MILLALGLACQAPEAEPPPDILLVVLDTVRRDRLSAYGHERRTSPQLEAVAEAGLLYTQAESPSPWTYPAHASLFTGKGPWEHGGRRWVQGEDIVTRAPDPALPLLAEQLSAQGYRTVAACSNPWLKEGLTEGFELAQFGEDRETVAAAREALAVEDDRPLFLFVNLMAAHAPYDAWPVPWLEGRDWSEEGAPEWARPLLIEGSGQGLDTYRRIDGVAAHELFSQGRLQIPPEGLELLGELYDAGVSAADHQLKRVLAAWNASGRQGGLVVVTSDHGEHLGEQGQLDHGHSLYAAVTDIPLVVAWPGQLSPARIDEPVSLTQVHGSLLAAAGVEAEGQGLPGFGGASQEHLGGAVWGGREGDLRRVRRGDEVLLSFEDKAELYRVDQDPGMRSPAASTGELEALLPGPERPGGAPLALDGVQEAALKALGYLD